MKVAFIIVNYQKAARAAEGIRSIKRQNGPADLHIVVVDNSVSHEESEVLRAAMGPNDVLITSPENLGYTRGVNLSSKAAGLCDYIVLVSPDIVIDDPGAIQRMVAIMENDRTIGVLGTVQHNDDGSVVEVARRFPSPIGQIRRRLIRGADSDFDLIKPETKESGGLVDVDWMQSSFVMVRRSLWSSIGGLDERYFIFMSDIVLCRRAYEMGMRVVVTSAVDVRADGVRASHGGLGAVFRSKVLRIHIRDTLLYYLRYGLGRSRVGPKQA